MIQKVLSNLLSFDRCIAFTLFFPRVKTFWIVRKRDETFIAWVAGQNNEITSGLISINELLKGPYSAAYENAEKKRPEIRLRSHATISFSSYLLRRHT